jgi:hypothetical protein
VEIADHTAQFAQRHADAFGGESAVELVEGVTEPGTTGLS